MQLIIAIGLAIARVAKPRKFLSDFIVLSLKERLYPDL
jgi:hypothetical protein